MNFLVTGGAGFIGSHVVEHLLAQGHSVIVVDNLTTGKTQNLPTHPQLKLILKDIRDCGANDFPMPIDGIAHLAATPSVAQSWLQPLAAHENNISATVAVIQLCQQLKIPRLVLTSSAAVYGNPSQIPISEAQLTAPISPYGLQKLVSEQYAGLFSRQFGFSAVNLRLFNVFGPRQDPNSPYSGVISIFLKAMQQGLPISIYGDGTQTRDFVYVKDIANAFACALLAEIAPSTCLTFNIGTGKTVSLLELVSTLQTCFPDWNSGVTFHSLRTGDIQHSQADITQASTKLGFRPEWSIQDGLFHLVQHLVRHDDACQSLPTTSRM